MAASQAQDAAATFAALEKALDRMAARKVAVCGSVVRDLAALLKSLDRLAEASNLAVRRQATWGMSPEGLTAVHNEAMYRQPIDRFGNVEFMY